MTIGVRGKVENVPPLFWVLEMAVGTGVSRTTKLSAGRGVMVGVGGIRVRVGRGVGLLSSVGVGVSLAVGGMRVGLGVKVGVGVGVLG